jgi:uncharacterized protein
MAFEWDDQKNALNSVKYGIDFNDAIRIFDKVVVELEDNRFDYDEKRIQAFGEVNGFVVCVVYTDRPPNSRIISARLAKRKERNLYYAKIEHGLGATQKNDG